MTRTHRAIAVLLHADIDRNVFSEPAEEATLVEDDVWTLEKTSYGHKKAPRYKRQHVVTLEERMNFFLLLTSMSLLQNSDMDVDSTR